jgi:cyclohexanecarboxylate-CoA ligase
MISRTFSARSDAIGYERARDWGSATLDQYLRAAARERPDTLAVVDRGTRYTYRELDRLAAKTWSLLAQRGIAAADVVAWQMPNRVEALALHHAIIRAGAISVPIIPIYRQREVEFILRQSGAVAYFAPESFRGFSFGEMISEMAPRLPSLRTVALYGNDGWDTRALAPGGDGDPVPAGPAHQNVASDVAVILYTSGTTSDPKGALHTHQTLDYENRSIVGLWDVGPEDVVFMPSPVTHVTGLLYGMQLPFMVGGSVVLQDIWDAGRAIDLIQANRSTLLVGATPFLQGILDHPDRASRDLSSLRVAACGGADVPPELVRRFEAETGTMTCRIYGSTEFPTLSGANGTDPAGKRAETDGRPIGAARARIAGKANTEAKGVMVGPLQVRGPELFAGYLDASLNADAFDDGWFRTGDLAIIDAEGYVTIVGREKDIIIRGGENISAREIEDLLFSHPLIADVAVVAMPDDIMVERVCAYLVLTEGAQLTVGDLAVYLDSFKIAKQKWPERVEILTALPRTPSGKVQKFRLRNDIGERLAAEKARTRS